MIQKQEAKKRGIKILDSNKPCNALLENLKANFPQTIKDGQVDLKAIALLLGLSDKANMQGYELTFTGKGLANALYTTPCQKVLKHKEIFCHSESALAGEESQNQSNEVQTLKSVVGVEGEFEREEGATSQFKPLRPLIKENSNNKEISAFSNLGNATQNTLIIGDNLDALKLLKSAYSEKIKMIYIDPPYNTGNDNFIYPDDFRADYKAILREVGLLEIDENGQEVESETLQFFRNITGSKSHSGWLCFMLPRLKLARDLLREDGVIFISIDDNEQANLKLLCDEIFGEENFCGNIIWLKGNAQNDADTIQSNQEYILCYAKNIESKPINQILQKEEVKAFKDSKTGKFYYEGAGLTMGGGDGGSLENRPNLGYTFYYNPQTQDIKPILDYDKDSVKSITSHDELYNDDKELIEQGYVPIRPPKMGAGNGRWKWALEKSLNEIDRILIKKSKNGYSVLRKEWLDSKKVKQDEKGEYYAIIDKYNPPKSFIDFAGSGSGTSELKKLFESKVFTNPKNTKLLKHLLKISTSPHTQNSAHTDTSRGGGLQAS